MGFIFPSHLMSWTRIPAPTGTATAYHPMAGHAGHVNSAFQVCATLPAMCHSITGRTSTVQSTWVGATQLDEMVSVRLQCYLRPETLHAANDAISNATAALSAFKLFNIREELHSSSDGQRFETQINTFNSKYSPKYYAATDRLRTRTDQRPGSSAFLRHRPIAQIGVS